MRAPRLSIACIFDIFFGAKARQDSLGSPLLLSNMTAPSTPQRYPLCESSEPVSSDKILEHACFTRLPVRRHRKHDLHNSVEEQLFRDWKNIVADGTTDMCRANTNPIAGGWDSLTLSESKPERLYYTMWLTTFLFLLDGIFTTSTHRIPQTGANCTAQTKRKHCTCMKSVRSTHHKLVAC